MLFKSNLAILACFFVSIGAFGSSDDKFLKKYAMMKIYESCFGVDVVKEIRQEMKAACLKCAGPSEPENNYQQSSQPQNVRVPPSFGPPNNIYTRLGEAVSQDANQNEIPVQMAAAPSQMGVDQPAFDIKKLHQAIYSYRGQQQFPQQPFQNVPSFDFQNPYAIPQFQQPYGQQWYPQPYIGQFQGPLYQQQPAFQFYNNRLSREMDFKNSLEILTSRTSGKVRNVTCVMQELGYLDYNLEPNYEKIAERIANLPIHKDLKSDMQDGLQFCQQFAQCVPDTRRENSPLSRELVKPMFFFKCYKHKKLEACIMKDVRDRFATEGEFNTDTDFRSISRVGRGLGGKKSEADSIKKATDTDEDGDTILDDFFYANSDFEQDLFPSFSL